MIISFWSPEFIKIQYEYLSDMIRDLEGKVHGSQSHIIANNNMNLIVYQEASAVEGQREPYHLLGLLQF